MKNNTLVYGLIGLVVGSLLTYVLTGTSNPGMMQQSNSKMAAEKNDSKMGMGMGKSMDDMMDGLDEKTGDEFDKAFLEEMIIHHKGAVEMAKEAQKNAKHDEIKQLSNEIITAQEKEILQMQEWQKNWGY
jgi:uncharacterized protein (DUF305 family)